MSKVIRADLETATRSRAYRQLFDEMKKAFPHLTVKHGVRRGEETNELVFFSKTSVGLRKRFWQRTASVAYPCVCTVFFGHDVLVDYDWDGGTPELATHIANVLKLFQTKHEGLNFNDIIIRKMSHLGLSLNEKGRQEYI